MNVILLIIVGIFTLFNILISGFMTYNMIITAIKCKCAVTNVYWFLILVYFIFSAIVLVYTLLVSLNIAPNDNLIYLITIYVVSTLIFTVGSMFYTKYLKSKDCNCVGYHYTKLLHVITYLRFMMAVITGISLVLWSLYVMFSSNKK